MSDNIIPFKRKLKIGRRKLTEQEIKDLYEQATTKKSKTCIKCRRYVSIDKFPNDGIYSYRNTCLSCNVQKIRDQNFELLRQQQEKIDQELQRLDQKIDQAQRYTTQSGPIIDPKNVEDMHEYKRKRNG